MAGTGRLAARRKARLLPTGRVAHGLAQRSRAVHPLPPPRLETEQRSSPPPLPPPCAVRPTRRHSAPRHCSTWGPTAASAAAAAAGPTAAAPFQIRLGRDPRRRVAGLEPPITIPGDRDPRLPHLLAGTHTYGAGTHSCHSTLRDPLGKVRVRPVRQSDLTFAGPPSATQERAHWPVSRLWAAMVTNYTLPGARLVSSTMKPTVATVA